MQSRESGDPAYGYGVSVGKFPQLGQRRVSPTQCGVLSQQLPSTVPRYITWAGWQPDGLTRCHLYDTMVSLVSCMRLDLGNIGRPHVGSATNPTAFDSMGIYNLRRFQRFLA